MKNYNLLTLSLFFTIFFIGCSTDNTDEILNETNVEEKSTFMLKSSKNSIIYEDGKSKIFKDGKLYMEYTIENENFTKDIQSKSSNQIQFLNTNLNKKFSLNNIEIVDDYSFKFDLYVDGDLRESNIVIESNQKLTISESKCPWCIGAYIVREVIKSLSDAYETTEQEDTCETAINACTSNGGFASVSRNEHGCQVQCEQPN